MSESIQGLTSAEVAERQRQGKTNAAVTLKTKSIKRIFYDNICTLFNLINVVLFVSLLLVGSYKNLLFIGVVFFNTIIGIIQEIRSKRSVDKLTILTETKAEVLRDGKTVQIPKEELVLDAALEKNEEKNIVKLSGGDGAKRSVTIVRPLKHSRAGDYTLVEAELVTGRTHQIRAHLSGAGHPLIGDQKYGDVKVNAYFKKKYGLTSQLLHAERLEFAGDAEILPGKSVRARTPKMFREIEKDLF